MTKDRNNMRAVINTFFPSLGAEGTKTIKDLKRKMVPIKEENIKIFNEEEKNIYFKEDSQKPSKIGKICRLCFK